MRVAFGAMGSALTSAHRNSRPCITASGVPALNLLHLPSTRSLTYQGLHRSVLAGRTMHHPRLLTLNSQVHRDSAPHLLTSNQVNVDCSIRRSLNRRPANRSAPCRVAPLSPNQTSASSPSRSIEVTPLTSTSSALGGHTVSLKSSADGPSRRPVNLMVIRPS